eukprot:2832939-Prymnesium_polylepis.2
MPHAWCRSNMRSRHEGIDVRAGAHHLITRTRMYCFIGHRHPCHRAAAPCLRSCAMVALAAPV